MGMDWSVREGYAWAEVSSYQPHSQFVPFGPLPPSKLCFKNLITIAGNVCISKDKEHCEEYGRMLQADASKVSKRAKKRGLPQLGTLGAGNHYCEIQVRFYHMSRKCDIYFYLRCCDVHGGFLRGA